MYCIPTSCTEMVHSCCGSRATSAKSLSQELLSQQVYMILSSKKSTSEAYCETMLLDRVVFTHKGSVLIVLGADDTIITWSDPEVGTDIALSFQESVGCSFIWYAHQPRVNCETSVDRQRQYTCQVRYHLTHTFMAAPSNANPCMLIFADCCAGTKYSRPSCRCSVTGIKVS